MRIAQSLFEHQKAFLVDGPGHLAPLRMTELAAELGMHTSTVSRAVAGKYAQTPWGCFPLRHFFQAAVGSDEGTARDDVRSVVRQLFEREDAHAPLSDDDVVAQMKSRGFALARRTVAKYRAELGIPSSYRRRKFSS
jgi:RNA polymerase sigma-54 factor